MAGRTFLATRRTSECAYGIDDVHGGIYYMDVDFRMNEITIHQANVLSHPCITKVHLSTEMFELIGVLWEEHRQKLAQEQEG